MAKLSMMAGSTDQTLLLFIQDSSKTDGSGLTGLAYNTSGLTCYYARPGSSAAAISLASQTVTGSHTDGGFVEVDGTNMPGVYRLDLPDAVVASGVRSAVIMLSGAANMVPCLIEIDLQAQADAVAISGDTTAADNLEAACDGTGYNVGGGSVVVASVTGNVGGSVASVTGNVGGNVAGSVGSVTAGVTLADDAITAAKFDEATAFPLTAADTGSTAVARTGADSDTLETLSDQIDALVNDIMGEAVEGTTTLKQGLRLMMSALLAKVSGCDVNSPVFRDIGDTKNRITATTDAYGNRTSVTLDGS